MFIPPNTDLVEKISKVDRKRDGVAEAFADEIIAALPIEKGRGLHRNGHPFTRKEVDHTLSAHRAKLKQQLSTQPRQGRESVQQYIERMRPYVGSLFTRVSSAKAHIAEYDAQDEAQARQASADALREAEARHAKLVAEASPSPEVIARLCSTIERAGPAERLIDQVYAALTTHRMAQEARKELQRIYGAEQIARQALGKTRLKRVVPAAPNGAIEFNDLMIAAVRR